MKAYPSVSWCTAFLSFLFTCFFCVQPARASVVGKIFWTDPYTDSITQANPDGSGISPLITGLFNPSALTVAGQHLYWTEQSPTNVIRRANLDGTNVETLFSTTSWVTDIAVDVPNALIYWTEHATDRIRVANLDGFGMRDVIAVGIDRPSGLDLDSTAGQLYWTEKAGKMIRRANVDGTNVEDLLSTDPVSGVAIALDVPNQKMYFIAGTQIRRADLDGTNMETIAGGGYPSGIALDRVAGRMYWCAQGLDAVLSSNCDGSDVLTIADSSDGVSFPTSIAVVPIPEPITLTLDFLPGSDRNPFVPKEKGLGRIPMVIFATEEVAAEDIIPESIKIVGVLSPVKISTDKDMDGDGLVDLVMYFSRRALIDALSLDTYEVGEVVDVTVTAALVGDGSPIEATDSIVIVGPGN